MVVMKTVICTLIALGQIATAQAATVIVTVAGIATPEGMINVGLCNKSLSREGCPYSAESRAAVGTIEIRFEGVPPGRYAIVGYHDVNANHEFDRLLGVPREPFALSNEAATKLAPKFEDAVLSVGPEETRVVIQLRKFLGR
jgi:uncharacterized protein (DUF2141 family)